MSVKSRSRVVLLVLVTALAAGKPITSIAQGDGRLDALERVAGPLVCPYCISNKDVGIQGSQSRVLDLTFSVFRSGREPSGKTEIIANNGNRIRADIEALHDLGSNFIGWKTEFEPYTFEAVTPGLRYRYSLPAVVRRQENSTTWSQLVKTEHLCIGSQFKIASYYLVGTDRLPMAMPPQQEKQAPLVYQVSAEYAQIPQVPFQTICEGELLPIKEYLATFVQEQLKTTLNDFSNRTAPQTIADLVKAATIAWLNENHGLLASDLARARVAP